MNCAVRKKDIRDLLPIVQKFDILMVRFKLNFSLSVFIHCVGTIRIDDEL